MDETVKVKFETYPQNIKIQLMVIRTLIFELAIQQNLGHVDEKLKWGEPSYQVKNGSPIRLGWKQKNPSNYFIYFNCKTKLVDTFREVYKDKLSFERSRAILIKSSDTLPVIQITQCLSLALRYHSIKHLPLLGI